MPVLLIHKNPQLMDECCNLINMEWPRSKTARMRTLQMSCDNLPTCLVLTVENKVVGHSKISPINGTPGACFVESVIIHPNYRGKGLGRMLMKETEKYAESQGIENIFLSTTDQQEFYKKLGYIECPPVSIFGYSSYFKRTEEKQFEPFKMEKLQKHLSDIPMNDSKIPKKIPQAKTDQSSIPLPPPLPSLSHRPSHFATPQKSNSINSNFYMKKTYFKKQLPNAI